MKRFLNKKTGFTLVELLIVIALIAILSVAVLATINPIEQTNKARDASVQNDAAEVLSAYERFYASQNAYPWNSVAFTVPVATGNVLALRSDDTRFGILSAPLDAGGKIPSQGVNGNNTGSLINTSELKSAFGQKPYFAEDLSVAANAVDAMYVVNNGTDSNYVCFVPKANANRIKTASLYCLTATGVGAKFDSYTGVGGNCAAVSDWKTNTQMRPNAGVAFLICVPTASGVSF